MRSLFRRPRRKCNYQLTKWIRGEENVQFAIEQLEQHGRPYEIRRSRNGMLSVWTCYDEEEAADEDLERVSKSMSRAS